MTLVIVLMVTEVVVIRHYHDEQPTTLDEEVFFTIISLPFVEDASEVPGAFHAHVVHGIIVQSNIRQHYFGVL